MSFKGGGDVPVTPETQLVTVNGHPVVIEQIITSGELLVTMTMTIAISLILAVIVLYLFGGRR